jgi:hypothetical protein
MYNIGSYVLLWSTWDKTSHNLNLVKADCCIKYFLKNYDIKPS